MYLFLLLIFAVLPMVAAAIIMRTVKARHSKYHNPLTKSLRRPPGAELGRKLGAEQLEAGFGVVEVMWAGLIPIIAYMAVQRSDSANTQLIVMVAAIAAAIVMWMVAVKRLVRRLDAIRILRLGYECELAVGQELDLLMLHGYRVFHDLPAENFNIDHVVVGPSGIYAVETKGRSKLAPEPDKKNGNFRVSYVNGQLEFPTHRDTETIPQAVRQAKWLSKWLTSATGLSVQSVPLVVLPGWFVDIKDRPVVPVIASGYIEGYFKRRTSNQLDSESITRIVHQLDAKVRDLKPGELVRPKPLEEITP